ncbi:MAG: hypothetical protein AAFP90_00550 [Planctomycetota bacterium]
MVRHFLALLLLLSIFLGANTRSVLATADDLATVDVDANMPADESVDYQLSTWKKKHLHDAKKAEVIIKTMKALKIEVKTAQHNGHIDLSYRCPKWKKMNLKTHEEAQKWMKWFKDYGFEAKHEH